MGGALAFWMGNPFLNPATLVLMGFGRGLGFEGIRRGAGAGMVCAGWAVVANGGWVNAHTAGQTEI
ncbi:inner membrane permease [Escherichia coli]|nr:inner membrane permease [Escherichia coli]